MNSITFFVPGDAIAQGSKAAWVLPGTRRAVLVDAGRARTHLKPWRMNVAFGAQAALAGRPWDQSRAIRLDCTFYFARPKSHYGTGKNANVVKDASPRAHTTKPDRDKLLRAVQDALTGVMYRDDSQVYAGNTLKLYCGEGQGPGVAVTVTAD